jgi:hypothetical protein
VIVSHASDDESSRERGASVDYVPFRPPTPSQDADATPDLAPEESRHLSAPASVDSTPRDSLDEAFTDSEQRFHSPKSPTGDYLLSRGDSAECRNDWFKEADI